jgi:hypothetical protein
MSDLLAAQADLMLAHYPADVTEQIIELLCLLVLKLGGAENGVRWLPSVHRRGPGLEV